MGEMHIQMNILSTKKQLRLLFNLFFYSYAVALMLSTYHRIDIRNRQINKLQIQLQLVSGFVCNLA